MKHEQISRSLRVDFREFCVDNLTLRQIDDSFAVARIERNTLSKASHTSLRRTRVEEYYADLDWTSSADAQRFLGVLQHAMYQSHLEGAPRKQLIEILEREGYALEGLKIVGINRSAVSAVDVDDVVRQHLRDQLLALENAEANARGFAFERLLTDAFTVYGLAPRSPLRLQGEQIDGSLQLGSDTYLVEAKWQKSPTPQADLLVFREKVESKSAWTRGLFISHSGFSSDALVAFARGRSTNIIGMDGQDLYFVLNGELSLSSAIELKVRRAAETGEFFVPIFTLIRE